MDKRGSADNYTIYCLLLDDEHYYVGRTTDLQRRLQEHAAGNGPDWVKLHPYRDLYRTWETCDSFDEDKYVKKMMRDHGIDKVRGGAYSQCVLSPEQRNALRTEINGATDACFLCDSTEHWARDCPQRTRGTNPLVRRTEQQETSYPFLSLISKGIMARGGMLRENENTDIICYKCGKPGHYSPDCPVTIYVTCYKCGKPGHMAPACGLTSRR